MRRLFLFPALALAVLSCEVSVGVQEPDTSAPNPSNGVNIVAGDAALVTDVIDGDTIDVSIDGSAYRVRYVGINTPERDEICFQEASAANTALVLGQTVTLARDVSETDRYGRLLRYVYVNGLNVNAELVRTGFAEAVEYPPDTAQTASFRDLEIQAQAANLGCHPTGIFNDGSSVR